MLSVDQLEQLAVDALEALKGNEITVVDVSEMTDVTSKLVIASGTSNRHVRSLAENVAMEAKRADYQPLGREGEDSGEWVLVDLGEVVVHVMLPETRDYYNLEKFWTDFKREE
ncbi:MAG: ribosome silencing factor [Gammaproteobacteria bacterium]|jgi:ribosome-associated protein|nr:ribosome silencing factor [Gammaproteobacteria bacterium]MBT3489753.1 ribosome silencing factor [Gammaproteobacteria bacterium]MBT3719714.1 ribosome silencing factor [Gammaproteobacteria bacterium]MBT3845488.1 ribosome silencing factor [Gammaproteobacteria bacterium]MBT3892891.1 ribosome silencing factor [Gammaproteobacteria bacterium]